MDVILRIESMHCGACIRRVTQSLQAIPGAAVKEVRLGAARLTLPEGKSPEIAISSLGKAGFTARQEEY